MLPVFLAVHSETEAWPAWRRGRDLERGAPERHQRGKSYLIEALASPVVDERIPPVLERRL